MSDTVGLDVLQDVHTRARVCVWECVYGLNFHSYLLKMCMGENFW